MSVYLEMLRAGNAGISLYREMSKPCKGVAESDQSGSAEAGSVIAESSADAPIRECVNRVKHFTHFAHLPKQAKEIKGQDLVPDETIKENPFCTEEFFDRYGTRMVEVWGMVRVQAIQLRAESKGIDPAMARHFAEARAVNEFVGDNRKACIECLHYRHRAGAGYGVCRAAGKAPLTHMARFARVHWSQVSRCQKHTQWADFSHLMMEGKSE